MIENDSQLAQARHAMATFEGALRALRARVEPLNPELFHAMAQDYVASINQVRAEIDDYIGLSAVTEAAAPLWMVLEGRTLSSEDVSSRLLAEWLKRLRLALHRVSSFLQTGMVPRGGRPDSALLSATDPRVLAVRPGSIRIGLRLPRSEVQSDFFTDSSAERAIATVALERLLVMVHWAASGSTEYPRDEFPDPDHASLIAQEAAKLVPSAKGAVRTVIFTGALVPSPEPIRASAELGPKLVGLAGLLSHTTEQQVTGTIREIDLDARRVILRERGDGLPDLKCFMGPELLSRAEELLDQLVTITGLISSSTPDVVNVLTIEPGVV